MALFDSVLDSVLSKISSSLSGDQTQTMIKGLISQMGGLKGLADRFNTGGLAEVFNSWVSLGENGGIRPEQIEAVLGNQTVQQIAQKLGIDTDQAAATLSQLLPQVIDRLTPDGVLKDLDGDGQPDAAPSTATSSNG
jgi:uncharacterized protein YidB (DUF937 family)